MGLIDAAGPGLVALGVLALPVLAVARWQCRSLWAGGLYLLGVGFLVVWMAKSVAIAHSSFDNPPSWPALSWMLGSVLAAGASVVVLWMRRRRRSASRSAS